MDLLTREGLRQAEKLLHDVNRSQRRDEATPGDSTGAWLDMPARDIKKYSILKAISRKLDSITARVHNTGSARFDDCLEGECDRELNKRFGDPAHQGTIRIPADVLYKRDLNVASASAGGYLVDTQNVGFIDMLRNRSVAFQMGAQRLSGLTGSVTIPRQTVGATVVWLSSETSTATESTPTFVQISASPKTCAAYHEISRQLMLQSDPSADQIVTAGLAASVATGVDAAVIAGSGASGQPQGIIGTSGVGAVTGTSLAYDDLLEFQSDLLSGNALLNTASVGFVTTPAVAAVLAFRQRFTGTDSPLWQGNLANGVMAGFPAMSSLQMPTGDLLFGDWSQVVVAEWGVLSVEVNPFASFQAGIVGIRCLWSVDVIVRNAASWSLATAVT